MATAKSKVEQDKIRDRLQDEKEFHYLTLEQLQERTGVSYVVLSNFLRGKSVSAATLRQLRDALYGDQEQAADQLEKLLWKVLGSPRPDTVAQVRTDVWRAIAKGYRLEGRPVPVHVQALAGTLPKSRPEKGGSATASHSKKQQ